MKKCHLSCMAVRHKSNHAKNNVVLFFKGPSRVPRPLGLLLYVGGVGCALWNVCRRENRTLRLIRSIRVHAIHPCVQSTYHWTQGLNPGLLHTVFPVSFFFFFFIHPGHICCTFSFPTLGKYIAVVPVCFFLNTSN